MKAVTIDNLDMKDHVRWAHDQQTYDTSLVTESAIVAPHPEILGMSLIYPSKFDELFELQNRNQHWAAFSPPSNFHLFSKRVFSYRLFRSIHWETDEEEENPEDENEPTTDLIRAVGRIKKSKDQPISAFENDKDCVLDLLESIQWLNQLLKQIYGRKLQYQKG